MKEMRKVLTYRSAPSAVFSSVPSPLRCSPVELRSTRIRTQAEVPAEGEFLPARLRHRLSNCGIRARPCQRARFLFAAAFEGTASPRSSMAAVTCSRNGTRRGNLLSCESIGRYCTANRKFLERGSRTRLQMIMRGRRFQLKLSEARVRPFVVTIIIGRGKKRQWK